MVDIAREAGNSGNYVLAAEIYERVIKEKGPAPELFVALGNSFAQAGRLGEALHSFQRAYRLGSVSPDKLSKLVSAFVRFIRERMCSSNNANKSGIFPELKDCMDTEPFFCGLCLGASTEPTTIFCGHSFCKKCLEKTDLSSCIVCGHGPPLKNYRPNIILSDALRLGFPQSDEVRKLKSEANMYFTEGNLTEAISCYTKILEIAPKEHLVWSNRSYAYLKLGNYSEAYSDTVMITKLRPQWAKGHFRKGEAEEALNRNQEAALSYMQCLALDSNAAQADERVTQILHNILKSAVTTEHLKHVVCTSEEPISQLMAHNGDEDLKQGIEKLKAILDEHLHQSDLELDFETRLQNCDRSKISRELFDCSLCYRLLYQPVTTPCGHTFCRHCLGRCLDHNDSCPQCRSTLQSYLACRNNSVNYGIQRMIELWFSKELEERQKQDTEDMNSFSVAETTAEIPIFVCTLAFPTLPCPLHVFEPRYRLMMRQAMESGVRQFGMCMYDEENGFAEHGTMLEINDISFFPDGRSVVDTVGGRRFRVLTRGMRDGYNTAKVEFIDDVKYQDTELQEVQCLHDRMYEEVTLWLNNLPARIRRNILEDYGPLPEKEPDIQAGRYGPRWSWWVIAILPVHPKGQLAVLGMNSLKDRLVTIERVLTFIQRKS